MNQASREIIRKARDNWKWWVIPVALTLGFLWLEGAFRLDRIGPEDIPEAPWGGAPAIAVVRKITKTRTVPLVGVVDSAVQGELSPRVMGEVQEVVAKPGASVHKGDPIVALRSTELDARLARATASVAGAKANLTQVTTDLERYRRLSARKAASPHEVEALETRRTIAQAAVDRATQAELEAQAWQAYSTVCAPADGVVGDVFVEVGDLVSPGRPVAIVYAADRLRLKFAVPAALRGSGVDSLRVRIPAAGWSKVVGDAELAASADPRSKSFTVRVALPEDDALTVGLAGYADWPVGEEQVLIAPASAVTNFGQIERVLLWDGKAARRRFVRTGRRFAGSVEILAGLHEGDRVLVEGTR